MNVIKELTKLKREHHRCDDPWYSCPLSEDGDFNLLEDPTRCTCGAKSHNEALDRLIEHLKRHKAPRKK